jgi:hypothetical protein
VRAFVEASQLRGRDRNGQLSGGVRRVVCSILAVVAPVTSTHGWGARQPAAGDDVSRWYHGAQVPTLAS